MTASEFLNLFPIGSSAETLINDAGHPLNFYGDRVHDVITNSFGVVETNFLKSCDYKLSDDYISYNF